MYETANTPAMFWLRGNQNNDCCTNPRGKNGFKDSAQSGGYCETEREIDSLLYDYAGKSSENRSRIGINTYENKFVVTIVQLTSILKKIFVFFSQRNAVSTFSKNAE